MGNSNWGIINQLLVRAEIIDSHIAWYADQQWTMLAIVLTNSWKFTIFVTIMVLARLQSIPEGFYEAAQMAGASRIQMFRDITFPNIKNVILIVLFLRGIWMFNKFDIIWILTAGGPGDATTTAPIFAYELGFLSRDLGGAAATSVILFVFLAIIGILYFIVLKPSEAVRVE
jgi:multiple sugar transport system permease protein